MLSSGVQNTAIRKRAQIAKENRMMFFWVAGASAVVGFALVVAYFLVSMILFNEKVLQTKESTIATLKADNSVVSELKNKVRALDANEALISAKANSNDETLQVVLDALPSEANSPALGASLQNKLLNISGLTLDSLQVDPVSGVETSDDSSTSSATVDESVDSGNVISFTFSATGSSDALKQALVNLEKSIRTIDVISVKIETQSDGDQAMTVSAQAFYEPAKTLELVEKVVKQ